MKFNKSGQAALEFLTTYGWAFLVILVMIGGLSYFGVFDFSKGLQESCSFSGKMECGESFLIQNATTDAVQIQLKNNNQQKVTVSSARIIEKSIVEGANIPDTTWCVDSTLNDDLSPGKFTDLKFDCTIGTLTSSGIEDNIGQKKIFVVEVTYKPLGTTINSTVAGEITTTVQG